MRKLLFMPVVLAMCLSDFGAFAATVRSSRSTTNNNTVAAPVAARAAVRGATRTTNNTTNAAPVAARAATRNTQKTTTQPATTASVAARAGAKQKVINMGTKISVATANTVLSQECQDAYFGCMDSFCMLENVTGGRCKCSDKNAEYDERLIEIQNMDQQSYVMQTEGVELLKMGKSADEVYAMAQDATDKVTGVKKEEAAAKKKSLDLSPWDKKWYDDDDVFEDDEDDIFSPLESDITGKTGNKLHSAAARICTQQIPVQCKASVSMLRMVYSQKIQSDCAAYSNSLKQQELESTQKLQTARQSLRDTALEKYQESNKYDLGGCVREYNTCMQRNDTCGEGFQNCVTLSASDNLQNKVVSQKPIIGSSIQLSESTMNQLLSKSVFCESILEQCVNVKGQVWDAFLRSAAPAIKTAEIDVETKLRNNCVTELTECFRNGCKDQMDPNNPDGSYDMCLSNPKLYKQLCKPKLEPCLLATGGTYDNPDGSSLWQGIVAVLTSLRVTACNNEVRDCLLSEDRCGKDYANCIGLSSNEIIQLCPFEKLTACMDENKNDRDAVHKYVASVAQGLALNIDKSLSDKCENALTEAMLTHCGAENACPNAIVDENMFKGSFSAQLCKKNDPTDCSTELSHFSETDLMSGKVSPVLQGGIDVSLLKYIHNNIDETGKSVKEPTAFKLSKEPTAFELSDEGKTVENPELQRLLKILNNNFDAIVNAIESDPKVVYCTSGRQVQGFEPNSFIGGTQNVNRIPRFPNLTQNVRRIIARDVLVDVPKMYLQQEAEANSGDLALMSQKLEGYINEKISTTKAQQDVVNTTLCSSVAENKGDDTVSTNYDSNTAVCTLMFYRKGEFLQDMPWQLPLVTAEYVTRNGNVVKNIERVKAETGLYYRGDKPDKYRADWNKYTAAEVAKMAIEAAK